MKLKIKYDISGPRRRIYLTHELTLYNFIMLKVNFIEFLKIKFKKSFSFGFKIEDNKIWISGS